MADKKRILVLYADAGFGHKSAAKAIASALEERFGENCEVRLHNPLDDRRTPQMLRDTQTDYDRMVTRLPELYKLSYQASDASVPTTLVESGLILLLYEVMHDLVKYYRPDAIISTYPLYQAPLDAVFTVGRMRVPLIVVVTDLATVHRLWFNDAVDQCLVPTEKVRDLAYEAGLMPRQVHISGIPVATELANETRSPQQVRLALGLKPDLVTLLAVGGKRVDGLAEALHAINHSGLPVQLLVVAGGDEGLYEQLQQTHWHAATRLYPFVNNMAELMHAADLVMCKAGGLIITEALACGRPMMLTNVLPGQEKGNADYVVESGAGEITADSLAALETLCHWLENDHRQLAERAAAARAVGRPQAAYEAAALVYAAATHGPTRRRRRGIPGRDRIQGLLDAQRIKP